MALLTASMPAAAAPAGPQATLTTPRAIQIRDDHGRLVQLKRPPQRIVSLLPSLTESVCALGACDRLVGVDRYSNWPAGVTRLPQVGGGVDPNVESIVAQRPDIVLASAASRGVERLQALGIPVLTIEPKGGMADARRVLGTLAQLLGLPAARADAVWAQAERQLREAVARMPAASKGMTVFFEASAGPYGAGPQSFIGEVLSALGLVNALPAELGPFPRLNPEYVVRARPQFIMSSERADLPDAAVPERVSFRYPGWNEMPAVREGRVCLFTRAQADVLVRPGPRLGEAAAIVADCVNRRVARTTGHAP
ncbi:ABC transporter substrate-binding protein [Comamonas serinivorans]|uniref:ABC transporter substrate-binding protein n=1 Tax=Comamonas serinivorans TaxID=1082851 RepID=UPI001F1ADC7F|nr:helical backbone metal receptor [Comamonas serinivorans]